MKTWKITYKYCRYTNYVTRAKEYRHEHILVAADSHKKAALMGKAVLDSWLNINRLQQDWTEQMNHVYDAKSYEITNVKSVKTEDFPGERVY